MARNGGGGADGNGGGSSSVLADEARFRLVCYITPDLFIIRVINTK